MLNKNEFETQNQDDLESSSIKNQINSYNKSQKIGVVFLAFFAVFIVLLWGAQFKNSLSGPFEYNPQPSESQQTLSYQEDSDEALKSKDTDQDGLSDYDELNIYKTSPYLEDSDSDGFSDKEEIASDNDPNCPVGRDCYNLSALENENVKIDKNQKSSSEIQDSITNLELKSDTEQEAELQKLLSGEMDINGIRRLLIESGMNEELLKQLSDEQILKTYKSILSLDTNTSAQ